MKKFVLTHVSHTETPLSKANCTSLCQENRLPFNRTTKVNINTKAHQSSVFGTRSI